MVGVTRIGEIEMILWWIVMIMVCVLDDNLQHAMSQEFTF
jgi:hypothetical protein